MLEFVSHRRGNTINLLHNPLLPTQIPHSHHNFLAANQPRSQRLNSFPTRDMAHQPKFARFQALFEPALQAYENKAGISLAQHPLALKLQNCDSFEAITGLLQDQAQAFRHFQGSDKVMKSIKATVSMLSKLPFAASLADAFGLVREQELVTCFTSLTVFLQTFPPARVIQTCLAILLDVRTILQFI